VLLLAIRVMLKSNHAEKRVAICEADASAGILATAAVPAVHRLGHLGIILAAAGKYQPNLAGSLHLHHRELHLAGGDSLRTAPHKAAVPVGLVRVSSRSSPGCRSASSIASVASRIVAGRTDHLLALDWFDIRIGTFFSLVTGVALFISGKAKARLERRNRELERQITVGKSSCRPMKPS
jgi:hypothetical protein